MSIYVYIYTKWCLKEGNHKVKGRKWNERVCWSVTMMDPKCRANLKVEQVVTKISSPPQISISSFHTSNPLYYIFFTCYSSHALISPKPLLFPSHSTPAPPPGMTTNPQNSSLGVLLSYLNPQRNGDPFLYSSNSIHKSNIIQCARCSTEEQIWWKGEMSFIGYRDDRIEF